MDGSREALRAFFDRYAAAFEAYDAAAVAAFYTAPALFVRDGVPTALETAEAIAESAGRLLDVHRAWGVETSRVAALAVVEAAPAHRAVRVDWRLGRRASRLRWTYATTYVLVEGDGDWRIAAALTHDAPF